jgi:hypothetical protein
MFFGSFNSSSFFCLGIILVLIGIFGYLISRKFQEQNLKITMMCDIVTTMAQDLQMLKMQNAVDKIQNTLHNQSVGSTSPFSASVKEEGDCIVVGKIGYNNVDNSNKIVVSDDEESYEDDMDESSLEDFDDLEELEEEDDAAIEVDDIDITEINEPSKPEIVDIDMFVDEPVLTKHIEITIEPEIVEPIKEQNTTNSHIIVNKLEETSSPDPLHLDENIDLSTQPLTDSLLPNLNKPKKSKPSRSLSVEESGESLDNLENFNGDYSKLNVSQLRKIVTDRGLSTHATKLKKTELLQLLGSGVTSFEVENIDI